MSDTAITIVRLDDLPGADLDRAADAVLRLLRERGAIGEATGDGWAPGPRSTELLAAEELDFYARHGQRPRHLVLQWNQVVVDRDWGCHSASENTEPPVCPRCGAEADPDALLDNVGSWFDEREEPLLGCPGCGVESRQGDWVGDVDVACGAPAVTFHNWGRLDPAFMRELEQALGGRTRWVRAHV